MNTDRWTQERYPNMAGLVAERFPPPAGPVRRPNRHDRLRAAALTQHRRLIQAVRKAVDDAVRRSV